MTEPRKEPVYGNIESRSDDHTKKSDDETVSSHHGDACLTSKYFQSNEEYWKGSTHASDSSDDDLPLAQRKSRRAAATSMIPPSMSQTSSSEPRGRRRGGPPVWENTQLYQDEDASLAVSTRPVRKRRPNTPSFHRPVGSHVYQEEAVFESDEQIAKRLQDQFTREAGLSGTVPYNAHRPVGTQWDRPPADRGSDIVKHENHDAPVEMQAICAHTGHPVNQNTRQIATTFGLSNSQAVSNIIGPQHPAYDILLKQSACWQNRFDHLPFRTSCNVCVAEVIACSKHHPQLGFCFQHGLPRIYSPAIVHDAGVEDVYDTLHEESPWTMRRSSAVRKLVAKPGPPRVVQLKKQEAILRELWPKEDQRGPPRA